MNTQKIKQLIQRYERGETSREEEVYLQTVFTGKDEIPFELRHYQVLFGYFKSRNEQKLSNPDFDTNFLDKLENTLPKPKRLSGKNNRYAFMAMAASVVILFGIYFSDLFISKPVETYDDPRLAYAETKKILMEVSGKLNTGFPELNNIREIDAGMHELKSLTNFDDGMKNFRKISVMNQSQKIITHKNK